MPINNKYLKRYQPPVQPLPRLNARRAQYRPYIPIPKDKLSEMIGKPIHLKWATEGKYHGCVWILISIEGDTIHLRTPKTGKKLTAKAFDAMYVRDLEPK